MFLYCSVTVFFFLLFLLEKKIYEKKYLLYISFGLLAILICFRNFTIGNDTQEYVNLFSLSYRTDLLQQLTSRYEIGFLFFNKVVYLINSNPHFYIFISGCIISVGYFKLIRDYSENYVFSVILFLLLGFFSNATNTLREQLAFFFLVFSYDSLKKNRIKSYFLFTFIAFLFHKTSIVFLLSYIAKKIEFNKRNVIAATCFMILAYYFFDSILNILISSLNFYTDYSNSIYRNGIIRQATILQVFIHISIFLFVFILKRINILKYDTIFKEYKLEFWFLFLSFFITFLSSKFTILSRVSSYFFAFVIILIPNIVEKLEIRHNKLFIGIVIIFLCMIYFFVIQIYRPEWNHIYPYSFFW